MMARKFDCLGQPNERLQSVSMGTESRSLVIYAMIAVVMAGAAAFINLGRNEDPAFTIKTMVVRAGWPGATLDDTLKQVTERLERKLQEIPEVDFLRSFTNAGVTTIFVNLKDATTSAEVPDVWYQVRKSIGDIRRHYRPALSGPAPTTISAIHSASYTASPRTVHPARTCRLC